MEELNELTKKLFSEGYTKENYPDYVRPYNWFYGGFTFEPWYERNMVFTTPCGLLVKGEHFISGHMSYMGVEWMSENNNPTVTCPYFEPCELNHELLRNNGAYGCRDERLISCACRQVSVPYDYEQSYDKAHDDVWDEANELFNDFKAIKHGRACKRISSYSRSTKQWKIYYDPRECAHEFCSTRMCPILQTELSGKKGNVYYDRKTTSTKKGVGLIPDEVVVTITKGIKALAKPVSITICQAIVKYAKHRIIKEAKESFEFRQFSRLYRDPAAKIELYNFRAESRATRDLFQNLSDLHEGYNVHHESDDRKAAKAEKHERHVKAHSDKKRRLKRKIISIGFEGLNQTEQNHYRKWYSPEEKSLITQELSIKREFEKNMQGGEQQSLY
jgi:hypothetical protein